MRIDVRALYQCRQASHGLQWMHDEMSGPISAAAFEPQHQSAGANALEPSIANRGAGDVAAQAFESLAPMHAAKHCRASFVKTPIAPTRLMPPAACRLSSGVPSVCAHLRG